MSEFDTSIDGVTVLDLEGCPRKEGVYWARRSEARQFDLIVKVLGSAPFLFIDSIMHVGSLGHHPVYIDEWGPQVSPILKSEI